MNSSSQSGSTRSLLLATFTVCATMAVAFLFLNSSPNTQMNALQSETLIEESLALFGAWKESFSVYYEDEVEENYRFYVFSENLKTIYAHNANRDATFSMGLTKFMDLTQEEFADRYLGYDADARDRTPRNYKIFEERDFPTEWNWTAKGAVTEVKNQGQCGSCWSFSSTGSTEGLCFLKTGILMSFSEQQIMDCSYTYGNKACKGGIMEHAFEYLIDKGDMLEHDYPYTGNSSVVCLYKAALTKFKPTGYQDVTPGNIDQLTAAVLEQPISIAVEADQASWQFYAGGVVTSTCGQKLDHGVLLTGYGTDAKNFTSWYVKNSWGELWGENGYIRIEKSDRNLCGILDQPSFPTA